MASNTYAKVIWEDFLSLVFPPTCINCKEALLKNEIHLCTACLLDLPKTNYHKQAQNSLSSKFLSNPKVSFATSFLHLHSRGVAEKMLYELKYKGNYDLGVFLGNQFGYDLQGQLISYDYLIPVPLHSSKFRKRGYNQSTAIAEGLSSTLGITSEENWVIRIKATSTQTKKSKIERWENVENIFQVAEEAQLHGSSVIVVDDVITTGATIGEFCEELVFKGVRKIAVLCIATGA